MRYLTTRCLLLGHVQGDETPTTVHVNGVPLEVPTGSMQVGDGPRVVLRFAGPPRAGWGRRLAEVGAHVEFWCPPHGACVTVGGEPAGLAALAEVAGVVPYDEQLCDRGIGRPDERDPGRAWLDVVCFSHAGRDGVAERLRLLGAPVLDVGHSKIRVLWPGDPAPIRDVVGVKVVERPRLPRPSATGLAADLGATPPSAPTGGWREDLDGTGEVLAIADTGLDSGDRTTVIEDLRGRVVALTSWPVNPSWTPFVTNPGADDGPADTGSGHGTFVAGVVAGDGSLSGGARRGVAPRARVVVDAIEQWVSISPGHPDLGVSRLALAGRPTDLRDLLAAARAHGAHLHVLAWGTPAHGAYDNDAYEADLYLHEHRDALVLVAAGNEGTDRDGNRRIDPGGIESPASAKNVLTVGATEGSDPNGFPVTWDRLQADGRVFANAADRTDPVYGQPDRMALLSSAGPTADGRVKPDVCAPGTCLVGPRSTRASGHGWGLASPLPSYVVDGGTSAAVAAAGGYAALLRQAWRRERGSRRPPAGATLKALAIVGAAPVLRRDGSGPEDRAICGYGRLDLDGSLPHPGDASTVRILCDATRRTGIRTGRSRAYPIDLPRGGRIRATLAWFDVPNERLVNDLDLSLTGPGQTAPIWGNHDVGAPMTPGGPDRVNTVEVVDVAGLAAGTWVLRVTGANVPEAPQPFALVARVWRET